MDRLGTSPVVVALANTAMAVLDGNSRTQQRELEIRFTQIMRDHRTEPLSAGEPHKWEDMPEDQRVVGFHVAVPNDPDTLLDGWSYEVVYVAFNGKWYVMRLGESKSEKLTDFTWLGLLKLRGCNGLF